MQTRCELFEVGVAVETGTIGGDELFAFFDSNFLFVDGFGHPRFEATHQSLGVILHILEHIGHRFAVDRLVDGISVGIDGDMHRIGVAEEIVHVAENLLVGTYEENADVIPIAHAESMQGDVIGLLIVVDVSRDFSVAVTRYVLNRGIAIGALVEPLDRHDGKELIDGPMVGERLEEGEVAKILLGHHLVQLAQFVGGVLEVVRKVDHFGADAPIEAFYLCTGAEIDEPVAEEVEGLFANVLGVVPIFEHGTRGKFVPNLGEVVH